MPCSTSFQLGFCSGETRQREVNFNPNGDEIFDYVHPDFGKCHGVSPCFSPQHSLEFLSSSNDKNLHLW